MNIISIVLNSLLTMSVLFVQKKFTSSIIFIGTYSPKE